MKRKWAWLALVLILALVAAACGDGDAGDDDGTTTTAGEDTGTTAASDELLRVAFVYVGPVGDAGWTWAHDQGRLQLEAEVPNVETRFLESIPEGSESQRVFEELAEEGFDLIFGTSFGYMDPMLAAAEEYPDTVFMHATGYKTSDNMGNYFGAAEEGRFLTGMAAGEATQNNKVGYVAAFPIPEVLRGINAFALGVKEVNPDATVQVVWSNTWLDPNLERQAAEALLDADCDVLAMHQDTPATGQAAEAVGAKWVGYNSSGERFAPDAWLTAPIWNWGPFYVQTAQQVRDGTWQPEAFYGDMAGGMVDIAEFGASVPQDVQDLILQRKQEIIDGTFEVFEGPIFDQDGNELYAEGVVAPLDELLATDYLVDNVIGSPTGG
jgi:basic membrane protein A